MAEFYRFPHGILTMLVMAVALCIVLQAQNISYSIRRLRAGWARHSGKREWNAPSWRCCFSLQLSWARYSTGCTGNFMAANSYAFARQVVFLLAAVLGDFRRCGNRVDLAIFRSGRGCCVTSHNREIAGPAYPSLFPGQSSVFPAPQRTYLPAAPTGAPYPNLLYLHQGSH